MTQMTQSNQKIYVAKATLGNYHVLENIQNIHLANREAARKRLDDELVEWHQRHIDTIQDSLDAFDAGATK